MSLLLAIALHLPQRQSSVTEETERFFNWMDSVGYTQELKKPFVKVPSKDEEWHPSIYGFLLREDRDSFEVMAPNVAIFTFHKKPTKNESHLGKYEMADLNQLVKNLLAKFAGNPENFPNQWFPMGTYELEALAWICKRKGLDSKSAAFIKLAVKQKIFQSGKGELSEAEVIAEAKGCVLAQMMHPLILRFEYPEFSLLQLHSRFADVVRRLKNPEDAKDFVEISNNLGKMVAQERAHGRRDVKKLSKEQQIQEYIWRLRYIGLDNSPYRSSRYELVKIGVDAIPYLKEALTDRTYLRILRWDGKATFLPMVTEDITTIGDYVQQVINEIEKKRSIER